MRAAEWPEKPGGFASNSTKISCADPLPPVKSDVDASRRTADQVLSAGAPSSAASISTWRRAKWSGCSGRTAPARRRRSGWSSGLVGPDAGRVLLDDQDVTRDPMYMRARKGIGYLPQEPSIFRGLTVEQNILAILETLPIGARRAAIAARGAAVGAGARAARALARLHAVGRRAAARRDHPRAREPAEVHAARRAVRRHRPDRRLGHPENRGPPEGQGHRRARDRSQRAGDAEDHRSRLYRARRRRSSAAAPRGVWRPTTTSSGFTSVPNSGWTKIDGQRQRRPEWPFNRSFTRASSRSSS